MRSAQGGQFDNWVMYPKLKTVCRILPRLAASIGKNAIGINIVKQSDANTVEVSRRVLATIQQAESQYQIVNLKFDIARTHQPSPLKLPTR